MDKEQVSMNVFEDKASKEDPPTGYISLNTVISLEGFKYDHSYYEQELDYLQPQLQAKGYRDIQWMPGETDSFGPLTRICKAINQYGYVTWFIYG